MSVTEPSFAFTMTADGRLSALVTEVGVAEPRDPSLSRHKAPSTTFRAVWDTGATNSAISPRIVKECSLRPTGVTQLHTADGSQRHNTYRVSIFLPNHVVVPEVTVSECNLLDADVLIGMDIIGAGDFAVTNPDGKTLFSFRLPSRERIDFVNPPPPRAPTGSSQPVGRNDLCPCGSGKKFKSCCMRKRAP